MADFEYPTVEQDGKCLGFVKMTALATAASLSSIPLFAKRAVVQCEGADTRWRADGSNPTATDGMLLAAGSERIFTVEDLSKIKFIQTSSGAILQVSYFG